MKARKGKADEYPRKDASGRLITETPCVPFILSSMGGLCREGHELLRIFNKKNKRRTQHLIDVLSTQHARWVAKRIRRALFGQELFSSTKTANSQAEQLVQEWR